MNRRALTALLLGALGIACAPIFVKLSEIGPVVTAFYRLAFAAPVFWVWTRAETAPRRPVSRRDRSVLVLAGLLFAADLAAWHWSLKLTSVANSTMLANFAPVFVTLGGWLVFRRRFRRLFVVGMVTALLGATLLSWKGEGTSLRGDALGLLTAVFYGSYILTVGRLREEFSTATILTWSTTVAAAVLLPVSWLAGESFVAHTVGGWAVLVGLALVSQVGGQGLIAHALAHLPAAFSSVTLLVQPAVAALLAWIVLHESIAPLQGLGAAITFAGILIARRAA